MRYILYFYLSFFIAITSHGMTECQMLHEAVASNSVHSVINALSVVNGDCRDGEKRTAMHVFAAHGENAMVFFQLIYWGKATLSLKSANGYTPLMEAVENKNKAALWMLFMHDNSGNPIGTNEQNYAGNTALHIAVMNNDPEFALRLLNLGADPTIRNFEGKTAEDIARALYLLKIQTIFAKNKEAKNHIENALSRR